MKNALLQYWKIFQKEGLRQTIWSFYSYYYTKYKTKNLDKLAPLKINIDEREIFVNPNDKGLSTELIVFGSHEPKTTEFIKKYVKKNMVCLDVGANIGYYSTLFSNLIGNDGKIISIEPSPVNFQYLEQNLELQNLKNFILLNIACGDSNKHVDFHLNQSGNKSKIVSDENSDDIISVEVKTLDELSQDLKLEQIDYLKIDVEGYEWEFINGAKKTIENFKPTIQIEFHRSIGKKLKEITDFLILNNYKIIFNDIGGDYGNIFSKNNFKNYLITQINDWSIIPKTQNSFKIIAEHHEMGERSKNF